jgi:hypothetical protein
MNIDRLSLVSLSWTHQHEDIDNCRRGGMYAGAEPWLEINVGKDWIRKGDFLGRLLIMYAPALCGQRCSSAIDARL